MWRPIGHSRKRLDRRQSLNASKRFAICDETTATVIPHANASRPFATGAKFSKRACVCITRTCGTVIRYFLNSTRTISPRSVTEVARVLCELKAQQNRLYDCTKFDKLIRYRCANLYFLVLPMELFRDSEVPVGWGALVESNGALTLIRRPVWQETTPENRIHFLQRIAAAGTRAFNRQLEITFDEIVAAHCRSF